MKAITVKQAAALVSGELCGVGDFEKSLGAIVTDSRAVREGDVFAAFVGEHTDGHAYISTALDKGAACCIAQRVPEGETRPVIVVENVQTAIETLAAAYRETLSIPVIGITGSVGKTSAKEMISAVLSRKYSVLKTDKNFNNQIGVPMTVSRIEAEHEAAVIEMGISDFGEMSGLARIVRPTIGVFTIIGHAHIEFLHDLNGVLRAKTEMLDYMDEGAPVVMNGDDALLAAFSCRQKKILFGLGENCDLRAENIRVNGVDGMHCDIVYADRRFAADIPAFGKHIVYAALEGAAVGILLGMSDDEIAAGIASYKTVGRRAAVCDTGTVTLIDDCYNANPDSVKSGIDSMLTVAGRHVCVLGDMLELGENENEMHRAIGEYALQAGVDLVLTAGVRSTHTARGAGSIGVHYNTREELIKALPGHIRKGDVVLVKASHSQKFEEVSEAIKTL